MNNVNIPAGENAQITLLGEFDLALNQFIKLNLGSLDFNYNLIVVNTNNQELLKHNVKNKLTYDGNYFGWRFDHPFKIYLETVENQAKSVSYEIIIEETPEE